MPALSGSPWRGQAKAIKVDTGGERRFAVGIGITGSGDAENGDRDGWEVAPGGTIELTYQTGTSGLTPPGAPNYVEIQIVLPDGPLNTTFATKIQNPTNGTTYMIHMDDDPLDAVLGAARAGMLEIYVYADRTDLGTYTIDSRGNGADSNDEWAQGYVRARPTLASHSLSNVAIDGAEPAQWAFDDPIHARASLDAPLYRSGELRARIRDDGGTAVQTAAMSSSDVTQSLSWTGTGSKIDNSFDVGLDDLVILFPGRTFGGDEEYIWVASGHDAAFTRESDLVLADGARLDVDPRITVDHHLQITGSAMATPPGVNDRSPKTAKVTDAAFVGFRLVNARSEGINGLTATETFGDAANEYPDDVDRSVTTATVGGEGGWCPTLAAWASVKPGGAWTHAVDVTSPAHATDLEVGPSETFTLLAPNTEIGVIVGGGPATVGAQGDHWSPGQDLLVGVALYRENLSNLITPDADPTPYAAIGRFRSDLGVVEYLDANYDWQTLVAGTPATPHELAPSPADSRVFTLSISAAETGAWTNPTIDLFVVGVAHENSVPYWNFSPLPVLGDANDHSGYQFDGAGFVGFPSR